MGRYLLMGSCLDISARTAINYLISAQKNISYTMNHAVEARQMMKAAQIGFHVSNVILYLT